MSSFSTYLLGFIVLIIGLAIAAYLLIGPSIWIAVGAIVLIGIGILGVIAEVIEWSLSGKYARKYGGSRRAGWGAIIGGMIGAFAGVPVPIVGPMIGAFAGSFIGALVAELSTGNRAGASTKVATGALLGRVLATAVKMGIGCAIASWIFFAAMG